MTERILQRTYSNYLHRTMNMYEYGTGTAGCLIIPTEGGRFFDFENFGVLQACAEVSDSGRIRFFCCDSVDREAIARPDGSVAERMAVQLQWQAYVTQELYPLLLRRLTLNQTVSAPPRLYVAGYGMGGYQAANLFFGHPQLFDGLLALSAFYNLSDRLGGCLSDEIVSQSPWHQVYGYSDDELRRFFPARGDSGFRNIILGCGSGAWEEDCLRSLDSMEQLLRWKKIPASVLRFGPNAVHDWCSWREQVPLCLKKMLV